MSKSPQHGLGRGESGSRRVPTRLRAVSAGLSRRSRSVRRSGEREPIEDMIDPP